ncbi:hypothetical protein EIP91_003936 [Steccherinum ochraceum]|uniref:Uncharacterized protein n=1 Tax=Steccherinum ochraceum TaxID=92696 RepID=A0A4V2MXI9_9APHY|nr:hypothetical protein EIP91_003936 [Steccherinum ochraceum]
MAGVPPIIPPVATEQGLHTPSQEWADKTTTALRDPATTGTANSMNPTTQQVLSSTSASVPPPTARAPSGDPRVPGAFQSDDLDHQTTGMDMLKEKVSDAATSVGETAKQYLPQAAQYLPKSVVETVQGYLPAQSAQETTQASTHDIPHRTSLPSTEITGAGDHEHVGGVGSLPGTVGETGVARLPDETPTPYNEPSAGAGSTGTVGVAGGAGAVAGLGGVAQAVKTRVMGSENANTTLPSYETTGAQPGEHVGAGVGALPGHLSEPGVARLPDEHSTSTSSRQAGDSHAAGGLDKDFAAGATGAGLGITGAGAAAAAYKSSEKNVALPGGMDDRTSGVGAGGDLNTHHSQARPAVSPDSQYSQPSFHQDSSKATGVAAVGASGAAAGGMLAGGGFGGREQGQGQQPLTTSPSDSQTVGDSQKSAMESRGTHTDTTATSNANVAPIPSSAKADATGKEGEKVGRELKSGGLEKETQFSGAEGKKDTSDSQKDKKENHEEKKETHKGAPNKGSDSSSAAGLAAHRSSSPHTPLNTGTCIDDLSEDEKAREREVVKVRAMGHSEREDKLRSDSGLRERMGMGDPGIERSAFAGRGDDERDDEGRPLELQANMREATTKARSHGLGREGATWGGVDIGGDKYRRHGRKEEEVEEGEDGDGYDTNYHPADLHPGSSDPSSTKPQQPSSETGQGLGASEASKKEGVSEKAHERSGTQSSSSSKDAGKKKVGFMEKMKGEAKVLLGHLEGGKKGEEKVEEGKRIKSGLPAKAAEGGAPAEGHKA